MKFPLPEWSYFENRRRNPKTKIAKIVRSYQKFVMNTEPFYLMNLLLFYDM